jgi:hypothetical protein
MPSRRLRRRIASMILEMLRSSAASHPGLQEGAL